MRKLTNLLTVLFLLLVFLASIAFLYYNTEPVTVTFVNWQWTSQPIAVWVISAFVLGGSLGLLTGLSLVKKIRYKAEIRRLEKQLAISQQEVSNLRFNSIKDLR